MDHLWSPWRYRYVNKLAPATGCIFCEKAASGDDESNLILYRGRYNFVLLNLFPYTNGHLMIAPFEHGGSLEAASPAAIGEMMSIVRLAERALRHVYNPGGFNIGMNLGECAGAGVADHLHMHVVPRWFGDANFMTITGETRVHIEEMNVTWKRLSAVLNEASGIS